MPGGARSYNPQSLLAAVTRHAQWLKGKQQHDAHELVRLLLDALHSEERRAEEHEWKRAVALARWGGWRRASLITAFLCCFSRLA